jgi:hypothetical protein
MTKYDQEIQSFLLTYCILISKENLSTNEKQQLKYVKSYLQWRRVL